MRVAMFYNDDAGGTVGAEDIQRAITRHGHEVVHIVGQDEDVSRVFSRPADLIVAAGGDGTVAAVARESGWHEVPLAVLPLGTANNIALSLGCDGPMDELIAHWSGAEVCRADLGIAGGPWGERRFVEAVGGGLVARSIATIDAQPLESSQSPDHRIELALGGYLNVLARLEAHPWRLQFDDRAIDGEFLLVEVLNIKSIGPNFVVACEADPFDGAFTIAVAVESDRQALLDYWQARMAGTPCPLELRTYWSSSVTIEAGDDLHVDDALFARPEAGRVELHVERGVLPVLLGPFPRD